MDMEREHILFMLSKHIAEMKMSDRKYDEAMMWYERAIKTGKNIVKNGELEYMNDILILRSKIIRIKRECKKQNMEPNYYCCVDEDMPDW